MEFANFTTIVKDKVEKIGCGSYKVEVHDIRENNGVVLKGLTIIQDNSNISPTIYINDYYREYQDGKSTISDIVDKVMNTYNRNRVGHSVDLKYFLDYEDVKKRIVYKLINTEKNRELLEDIPHMEFLDLSIVFQCMVAQDELGTASILIRNACLRLWDVSVEELYQVAKENAQRLQGYEIKRMAEVLCEIMKSEDPEKYNEDDCMSEFSDSVPMYVLSNKSRVEGAACMLYPDLVKDFAEAVGSSFYIIPSSIHELLLLPAGQDEDSEEIKSMIQEINDTRVSEEEILSYSLYFYDRDERNIIKL